MVELAGDVDDRGIGVVDDGVDPTIGLPHLLVRAGRHGRRPSGRGNHSRDGTKTHDERAEGRH